jgi:regulator of protease activity HflC (stomatin/prohibitin superfamily)
MMQEMTAERKKRALMAEAEGEAFAEVAKANADASATLIRAKAQADAIKLIAEAESEYILKLKENTNTEIAGQIIMSQKYIDGMKTISNNPSDKVFLPNSFQGMFELSTNKN